MDFQTNFEPKVEPQVEPQVPQVPQVQVEPNFQPIHNNRNISNNNRAPGLDQREFTKGLHDLLQNQKEASIGQILNM